MPPCTAARNTYSLPKNPAIGGTPAMLNMNTVSQPASIGSVRPSPARSEIFSSAMPLRRIARMQAKVPAFMNT